ncbi:MAG: hypothetical protein AAF414_21350, partial [Pseudomonadota bacterium]
SDQKVSDQKVYVSITGLRLKGPRHGPRFFWHAMRSMTQARKADGNISVATRSVDGVHHTLTVWRDEAAMRAFLVAGAHRQAMKAFPSIGTGSTYGYASDTVPNWDEALEIWRQHGREVWARSRETEKPAGAR